MRAVSLGGGSLTAFEGLLPRFGLVVRLLGAGIEQIVALHPQEDAGVEQGSRARPQIGRFELREEGVGHLDDIDIPRVDLALLGQLDQQLDRFDLVVLGARFGRALLLVAVLAGDSIETDCVGQISHVLLPPWLCDQSSAGTSASAASSPSN
ncbi:MAG: hypothetical protein A07HN63_00221 [uncultured archaeon A07HN63]|nr:MAG: hypothetical protein A07HN63_00221 [uncultured archaeon A07HN63]